MNDRKIVATVSVAMNGMTYVGRGESDTPEEAIGAATADALARMPESDDASEREALPNEDTSHLSDARYASQSPDSSFHQ